MAPRPRAATAWTHLILALVARAAAFFLLDLQFGIEHTAHFSSAIRRTEHAADAPEKRPSQASAQSAAINKNAFRKMPGNKDGPSGGGSPFDPGAEGRDHVWVCLDRLGRSRKVAALDIGPEGREAALRLLEQIRVAPGVPGQRTLVGLAQPGETRLEKSEKVDAVETVSYTHLTLPTKA